MSGDRFRGRPLALIEKGKWQSLSESDGLLSKKIIINAA